MYGYHVKRVAVRELLEKRNAMIAGLWANTNLDNEPGTRAMALQDIEERTKEAINAIYDGPEEEVDLDSDPFFAAIKKPVMPEDYQAVNEDRKTLEVMKIVEPT